MSWLHEFKTFALKGNVVDLAIGVIIGVAFGKVVTSLVGDMIMPVIGLLVGGVDFSALSIKLHWPGSVAAPVEVKYGLFINTILDFLIISGVIFLAVKIMNQVRKTPSESPTTKECPECLMQVPIRARKCAHCCSPLTSL